MALEKAPITLAPQERVSAIVRKAVERVPVDEFLQLQYQTGMADPLERERINKGAEAIRKYTAEDEKPFNLDGGIKFSINPRVIASRRYLETVPLVQYLEARSIVLETARMRNIKAANEYEVMGLDGLEELLSRQEGLKNDINLTAAVSFAARHSA